MSRFHIGISGWRYAPWRKQFYPQGLAQRHELAFASRAVSSIEINGSFYALQTPQRYAQWRDDTPEDFVFSVKAPRYITHVRRLKEIAEPLANFFASGPLQLGDKLGPILWQFPPTLRFDPERFSEFLARLPHDRQSALEGARQCSERMKKSGAFDHCGNGTLRHAVEIRHESFRDPDFIDLLRKYKVALVVADTAGKWPYLEDLTADFVYVRLHGDAELYASGYTDEALARWDQRLRIWSRGQQPQDAQLAGARKAATHGAKDVYCYFDNDLKVRAPFDARRLLERLNLAGSLQTEPGKSPVEEALMPRGSKVKYTAEQKRKAEHIEDSYEAKGVPKGEAQARAWATVNKQSGGGDKKGGSGSTTREASKHQARQSSARRAARTRKGEPRPDQPLEGMTKAELMDRARTQNVAGRSTMRKAELVAALEQ